MINRGVKIEHLSGWFKKTPENGTDINMYLEYMRECNLAERKERPTKQEVGRVEKDREKRLKELEIRKK